jgi:hypothetical protein
MEITTRAPKNLSSNLIEQVRHAAMGIENAHEKLKASLSVDNTDEMKQLVVQQTSMVPVILNQQIKLLDSLETKFADAFTSACQAEIEEIATVAKHIQQTIDAVVVNAQPEAANNLCQSITRLNLLQQRISGKMMKFRM